MYKNDSDNKFNNTFGYGSSLMMILFDFFLNKEQDSNESMNILNMVICCKMMHRTCNAFISRRRLLWTKTRNFDQNKLNTVHRLLYDSNKSIHNKLVKFSNLKKLEFSERFDRPLKKGSLPSNLTELTFGIDFNQLLKTGDLPSSLTQLTFGSQFNRFLDQGVLPPNLIQLVLGYNFNQPIDQGVLPSSLTKLSFGVWFNQSLNQGSLPSSLTQLTFGYSFNQPLDQGSLPSSLTQLIFGFCFNQQLTCVLPNKLTHLTLGLYFSSLNMLPMVSDVFPRLVRLIVYEDIDNPKRELYILTDTMHRIVKEIDNGVKKVTYIRRKDVINC